MAATDTNVYLYLSSGNVEAVEFIEDSNKVGFYSGGIVHANEFVEISSGISMSGTQIKAVSFNEK